jgi:hypothetical protein
MGNDAAHEFGSVRMFNAHEIGSAQASTGWMHIDTDDVGELLMVFHECGGQRSQFTADTKHQEAPFTHMGKTTEPSHC